LRLMMSTAALVALLLTGLSIRLCDLLGSWTPHWWVAVPMAILLIGLGVQLVTLPLSVIGGFWLPRRYGLHHQTLARSALARVKASLVGALLMCFAALIVYGLLRSSAWWWLWAAGALFIGQVLLTFVTPIWLVPLFYRLTPLAEGDLRSRLLRLAERAGVPAIGVWVSGQSRRSRTAHPAVVGLRHPPPPLPLRTPLSDVPPHEVQAEPPFQPDEVEAVLAHELGHHAAGDIWRGLGVQAVLTVVVMWIADRVLIVGAAALGLSGPADVGGLPLLGLVTMAVSLLALPLVNGWSRHIETRADDFALELTRNPAPFIGAMERLADVNLAERKPHVLKELILYSHPSIDRRVARARARA